MSSNIHDTMNSSNSSPYLSNDVMIRILLRTDPSCIFKCILVCKEWLGIITEPYFRQDYFKIWLGHPKLLVGFLTYRYEYQLWETRYCDRPDRILVTLLPTNKLGRTIKALEPMKRRGFIISKSSSEDGFLLFGTIPNTFYVYKPFAAAARDLPPPPVKYKKVAVAIITQDSDNFKVILARTKPSSDNTLDLQTYSSSTGKWEEFKIPCITNSRLRLTGEPGLVSSKGTVYWPNYIKHSYCNNTNLAVYDMNKQCIALTCHLFRVDICCYDVSPQGSIRCAAYAGSETIRVWVLDEEGDEKTWKLMYVVNTKSMWAKHSSVLEPLFGCAGKPRFTFVSFVHGRRDCIYVELKRVLFLYNLDTEDLERISPGSYYESGDVPFDVSRKRNKLPLTLPELGMWPVSSPVLHLR